MSTRDPQGPRYGYVKGELDNPFGCDDPSKCYTHTPAAIEAERDKLRRAAAVEATTAMVGSVLKSRPLQIDGIDYTKDGIENVRQTLIAMRVACFEAGDWDGAAFTSHVIALLAYLIEVLEYVSL